MLVQPIDIFVYAWLMVALLCAAYVAWDQFSGNPEPAVMKWGFVLITLYMGPMGLLLYVMADKEPKPGSHEEFVKPLWKQGRRINRTLCGRGCYWYRRGGDCHGIDRISHVGRPDRRIHGGLSVWLADLSVAVHAQDDGRQLCRKSAP